MNNQFPPPIPQPEPKKYYCNCCGRELNLVEKVMYYDAQTGKPKTRKFWSCPAANQNNWDPYRHYDDYGKYLQDLERSRFQDI